MAIFAFLIISILSLYKQIASKSNLKPLEIAAVSSLEEESSIIKFYKTLESSERKVFSQNKEDGVTEAIFSLLNIPDLKKYYVEFSPADGTREHYLNSIF